MLASLLSTPLRHAFPGMFLKSFNKLAGRVLSVYKATRRGLYTPIKPFSSFIKHYIKSRVAEKNTCIGTNQKSYFSEEITERLNKTTSTDLLLSVKMAFFNSE